jgi:hypothetical protein
MERSKNFYLLVFELLKSGLRPSKICAKLSISKQALNYYTATLKRQGFIKKIGYGVWEILKDFEEKEVKTTPRVATNAYLKEVKEDSVRGHGLQFVLKLPRELRNWDRREELFIKQGIDFKPLFIGSFKAGQKLEFKGRKVWILDKSIVIYEKSSYLAETAEKAKSYAIYEFKALVKALEGLLGADFSRGGNYTFKVTRQHYALVKNALAKQYDKEGKKLEVYTDRGLWFIIDNSFNLHEAETLHPQTADTDNKKVQDFFNGIKKYEGFTPEFLVNTIGQNAVNMDNYAKHLQAHVESVQKLGTAVEELVKIVKKKDL